MKHAEIWFLEKLWNFFHFEDFGTTVANRAAMSCNGNTIRSHGLWCSGTVTWSHVMESVSKVRKAISLDWKFGSKVRKAISPDWKFGSKVRKAIFLDWKFGKSEKKFFAQNDWNHIFRSPHLSTNVALLRRGKLCFLSINFVFLASTELKRFWRNQCIQMLTVVEYTVSSK